MNSNRPLIRQHLRIGEDQKTNAEAVGKTTGKTISGVIREAIDIGMPVLVEQADQKSIQLLEQNQQALNIQRRISSGEAIADVMKENHREFI